MPEKIIEIVFMILNEVRKSNKSLQEIDLSSLADKGYTAAEITTSYSWLVERLTRVHERVKELHHEPSASLRVLNSVERFVIMPEAFGYLIQLREFNLISCAELEMIIERAMMSGFETLNVAAMQAIVASVLVESDNSSDTRAYILLNQNNTIH